MPSEFAPGSVKFAAFSGTCKRGSSVAEGNCPLGRKMLLPIWQRNGISAVGVPVQYCEGWPAGTTDGTGKGPWSGPLTAPHGPTDPTPVMSIKRLMPVQSDVAQALLPAVSRLEIGR